MTMLCVVQLDVVDEIALEMELRSRVHMFTRLRLEHICFDQFILISRTNTKIDTMCAFCV